MVVVGESRIHQYLLVCLRCFLSEFIVAGTLLGPMMSYHFDEDRGLNSSNVGLGYMSDKGLMGGIYHNSNHKPSVMLGKHWETPLNSVFNAGLTAGLVTGYPASPVLPMVVPELSANLGSPDNKLVLMIEPPAGKLSKGALVLQLRRAIK